MSKIKCPYSKIELQVALTTLPEDMLTDDAAANTADELQAALGSIDSQADFNKAVAAHHGITVEQYINSPNMNELMMQYNDYRVDAYIKAMTKNGFNHKQAWALCMAFMCPELFS